MDGAKRVGVGGAGAHAAGEVRFRRHNSGVRWQGNPPGRVAQGAATPSARRRPGYPLAGCSPAEPASVSPGRFRLSQRSARLQEQERRRADQRIGSVPGGPDSSSKGLRFFGLDNGVHRKLVDRIAEFAESVLGEANRKLTGKLAARLLIQIWRPAPTDVADRAEFMKEWSTTQRG